MSDVDYIQYPLKELLAKIAADQDAQADRWEEQFDDLGRRIDATFLQLNDRLRILESERPLSADRIRRFEELEREVPKLRALVEIHRHEGHPDIVKRLDELQRAVHDLNGFIGSMKEVSNFKRWSLGLAIGTLVSLGLGLARLLGGH